MIYKHRVLSISLLFIYSFLVSNDVYNICAIGDSHILFGLKSPNDFWENTKYIERDVTISEKVAKLNIFLKWIGSKTLHGASSVNFMPDVLFDLDMSSLDALMFSFGEIDIRWHIAKQSLLQNMSVEKIIEILVLRFFNTLSDLKKKLISFNGLWLILAPIPPIKKKVDRKLELPYVDEPYVELPFYGSIEERASINKLLIQTYEKYCPLYGFILFDPYVPFKNSDNTLQEQYASDAIHLEPGYNQSIINQLYIILKNQKTN